MTWKFGPKSGDPPIALTARIKIHQNDSQLPFQRDCSESRILKVSENWKRALCDPYKTIKQLRKHWKGRKNMWTVLILDGKVFSLWNIMSDFGYYVTPNFCSIAEPIASLNSVSNLLEKGYIKSWIRLCKISTFNYRTFPEDNLRTLYMIGRHLLVPRL